MKPRTAADEATAWTILDDCPVLHLAWVDADGLPDVRALHGARVGRAVYLHGAPVGDKTGALDRPVTLTGHEVVARIPSHFIEPERACPATTWYRSVHLRGTLRIEDDPERRAAGLDALMRAMQPEGGYRPLRADDPLYAGQLDKMLVARVDVEAIQGKVTMGQHRPARVPPVLAGLWRRGEGDDLRAFERIRAACDPPVDALPEVLRPHVTADGVATLHAFPSASDRAAALALLYPAYWNSHLPPEPVARGFDGALAWIGARDPDGRLIASAGAMSDGRRAYISDVIVDPAWRGRGLGDAVMRALLDHPRLRGCIAIGLRTRDAQPFYRRLGFTTGPLHARFPVDEMWLNRSP